jgi:U3 small nucleolar RNA-associated protein 22
MTALARSATRVVGEKGTAIGLPDAGRQLLFVPALSDFDVLLRLNKKALKATSRVYEHDDPNEVETHHSGGKFKNLDTRTGELPLPLGTHPARLLLNQLSATYSGPLAFFQGSEDDAIIGAIWNPLVSRRSFRVNLLGNYKPVAGAEGRKKKVDSESDSDKEEEEEDDLVEVDREAILAEIARIGGELVERIDVKGQ